MFLFVDDEMYLLFGLTFVHKRIWALELYLSGISLSSFVSFGKYFNFSMPEFFYV